MARVVKTSLDEKVTASRELRNQFANFAGKLSGFRPAPQVLTRVRGVRTIFVDVDRITKINAYPIERVTLIHGPSNHGKTEFCLGIGKSFLDQGHSFALIDAECSTPIDWPEGLGLPVDHPGFFAKRPRTYQEAVDAVTEWAESIAEARVKGELAPETTGFCAVDSITQLVPKELMDVMFNSETQELEDRKRKPPTKRGVDGMDGRGGQYQAALNNAWVKVLVPLVHATKTCIALITRERANPNAGKFDEDFVVCGGGGAFYNSSLVLRIQREASITDEKKRLLGERHSVQLRKTKIGSKDERMPKAYFHTSNGKSGYPAGFDPYRDLIDLAVRIGAVELKGAYYSFKGERIGQGIEKSCLALFKSKALFGAISELVRGLIDDANEKGVESFGEPVE